MRSFSVFVICFILAVLGPLKTSGAVSINENGGSKSLTENNEGSAVVQPKMEALATKNDESNTVGIAEEDSEKRRYPTDDAYEQLTCPAGTRVAYRRCILCSPGSYSDSDDSVTCTHCSGNTIASSSGSTECTECPAGYIAFQRVRCDLPCAAPTDAPVAPPSPVVAPTRPTRPIYAPFCRYKDGCYEHEPFDEPEKVK